MGTFPHINAVLKNVWNGANRARSHIPQFPSQRSVTETTQKAGKLKTSPALIDELINIIYPEAACGGGLHLRRCAVGWTDPVLGRHGAASLESLRLNQASHAGYADGGRLILAED
ncbi:hypothetical protein Baya_12496 [Bagarius yarrelli]|uniref:Uncharacterized protein n=1 Tax=Bagarius yarrelli TaxID=175774 RepID=A0A556V8I7_BAGYA|nr:hypothetical protein Baya_12496 [Bagarius yarrelli]